ncbi:hypothetical protein ACLOJK_005011 [Asimina triloba]
MATMPTSNKEIQLENIPFRVCPPEHVINDEGVSIDSKMVKAVSSKRGQCGGRHSESEVKCDSRNLDHPMEGIDKVVESLIDSGRNLKRNYTAECLASIIVVGGPD